MYMYEKLKGYKELLDEGIITEAEFEQKKRELLGMPDKEEEQRIAEGQRIKEAERQRKLEEEQKQAEEYQRKLKEAELAEREHQRKLEEAKLAEQERQRKKEEERKIELEQKQERKQAKKEKRKANRGKVLIVIVLIIVLAGGGILLGRHIKYSVPKEKIAWDNLKMGEMLPELEEKKGHIWGNDTDYLDVDISKESQESYNEYMNLCKEMGYIVDSVSENYSYRAYNKEGYKLELYYDSSNKELEITLEDPISNGTIKWESTGFMSLLPEPKSKTGEIESEYSDGVTLFITNTSIEDFNDYIDTCMSKGFDVDYYRYDDSYSAENEDGVSLNLYYEGNNIMQIHAYR